METTETRGERVRNIIKEYSPVFITSYQEALRQTNVMIDAAPQHFFVRSKANLLHNIMVNQIQSALFGDPRVKKNEEHDSLILEFDGIFMCRFKKLDQEGRPAKAATERNRAFVAAQLSIEFTEEKRGNPVPKTSAEIGYRINETWTEFLGIDIVCQNDYWSIPIESIGKTGFIVPTRKKNNDDESAVQQAS